MSDDNNGSLGHDDGEDVARVGFDRHRADDVIYQQYDPSPVGLATNPVDGLPSPAIDNRHPFAPPLALDTCVCLADESEFVRRDSWGVVFNRFPTDEVELMPNGTWRNKRDHLNVAPVRPQCRHMVRQLTDFQGDAQGVLLERCCTARRDSGGEFLSLRDVQMIACELRDPRDVESEDRLRRFDARKIREGAERRARGEGYDINSIDHEPDADLEGVLE